MMHKRGIVKTDGEICEVTIVRTSACGENCVDCGGCRLSETVIEAVNTVGAKAGDRVVLEVGDKIALTAAGLAYLVPVAVLFLSLLICYAAKLSEGICAIVALAALTASFAFVRVFSKTKEFSVQIVEILK